MIIVKKQKHVTKKFITGTIYKV